MFRSRDILISALCFLAATTVFAKGDLSPEASVQHLMNRFAFGSSRADRAVSLKDKLKTDQWIDQWFDQQLSPEKVENKTFHGKIKTLDHLSPKVRETQVETEEDKIPLSSDKSDRMAKKDLADEILDQMRQRKLLEAVHSNRQLEAVLTDFWFNHFNIDGRGPLVKIGLYSFEDEAIRPHVLGRFEDMLKATARSVSMLRYLNNAQSRVQGKKGRGGINENYARELMELHTLGVNGGYKQDDIINLARILTGWTTLKPRDGFGFEYRDKWHDKDQKTFLGQVFPAGKGQDEGDRALHILATHPSTARFLSQKFVRYFVSDKGNEPLEKHLADVFQKSSGDLKALTRALFQSSEFWSQDAVRAKVKKPLHFVASALRAVDADVSDPTVLLNQLSAMGETLYQFGPPTGYPDQGGYWLNANSFSQRLIFVNRLVRGNFEGVSIRQTFAKPDTIKETIDFLESKILSEKFEESTRRAISSVFLGDEAKPRKNKEDSVGIYVALALGSPQFHWR